MSSPVSVPSLPGIPALGVQARTLRVDAVSILSIYTMLLFVLPGRLVVKPIGAVGTPALLLGMMCALWWLLGRLSPTVGLDGGPQPVRIAVLVHGWFMLVAYAIAHTRPLTALESSGSDRAALTLLGLSGVALVIADGVSSRGRLDTLLRRVVIGAAIMASVGIVQFVTGVDPVQYLAIPGLTFVREYVGVASRSMFNRPYGTALHPIEFGVILGAVLPLALHYAFTSERPQGRWRSWLPVWLIAAGIPLSISRSAIVALVAGVSVMVGAWSWRRRTNVLVGGVAFTAMMWAGVPGLIGTIRSLFVGLETDPSIQARTNRVPHIRELFHERPWFGRGLGTYSVDDYFLVDNEWYVSAIETGMVGVAVIVAFILTGFLTARRASHLSGDETTKHLGYAIAAVLFALLASIGTFDAFFYRIFTGLLFMMVGCAGALWRLVRTRPGRQT